MKLWNLLSFAAAQNSCNANKVWDLNQVDHYAFRHLRGGGETFEPPEVHVPPKWAPGPKRALIMMDRFAEYHGIYLQHIALEVYGVAVVNVVSSYIRGYLIQELLGNDPSTSVPPALPSTKNEIKQWIHSIGVDRLEAVICESDAGLAEAEILGVNLKVARHNGINEGRRNKYVMNEIIHLAGLKVVKQKLCKTLEEAEGFAAELFVSSMENSIVVTDADGSNTDETMPGLLGKGRNYDTMNTPRCIVKPMRGAASDSVFLCETIKDVREAFHHIYNSSVLGSMTDRHDSVLVQEFAHGTEYALDIVSKNGEHKVAALWRYDKRPANGRSFVYFATELVDSHTPDATAICDYAKEALNALELKWGMTHTEVIMTPDGCRLVEINCRQHNMDFAPITMACIGYNALDMLLAAYLGDGLCVPGKEDMSLEWNLLPDKPVLRAHGAMVHFVNHAQGYLSGVNEAALREIQGMESVCDLQVYNSFLEIGRKIMPTVDIRSDAGWAHMMNDDREAFIRDYNRIVELMPQLFFVQDIQNQ